MDRLRRGAGDGEGKYAGRMCSVRGEGGNGRHGVLAETRRTFGPGAFWQEKGLLPRENFGPQVFQREGDAGTSEGAPFGARAKRRRTARRWAGEQGRRNGVDFSLGVRVPAASVPCADVCRVVHYCFAFRDCRLAFLRGPMFCFRGGHSRSQPRLFARTSQFLPLIYGAFVRFCLFRLFLSPPFAHSCAHDHPVHPVLPKQR